jgi:AcrR family transcriptional regulator
MTKKEPKEKRIDDIIQAAVEEFLDKGFDGTSMNAIAFRAGISKGGLYHHFNSKDEILIYANQKLNQPVTEMMIEAAKRSTALEALEWYIRNYLSYWLEHKKEMFFYFLTFTKALDSPVLWGMYERYTEACIHFFQGLFQKGIDSGEFYPHSTRDSALTLMAALDGIIGYLLMDKNLELEEIVSIFMDKFVYILKRKN